MQGIDSRSKIKSPSKARARLSSWFIRQTAEKLCISQGGCGAEWDMPTQGINRATLFQGGREPSFFWRLGSMGSTPVQRRPFESLMGVASSLTHENTSLSVVHGSRGNGADTLDRPELDQNTPDNPKDAGGLQSPSSAPGSRLGKMWPIHAV